MIKKRVVIIGSYGAGNIGDEAILTALIQNLPKNTFLHVLSGNPQKTEKEHQVSSSFHLPCGMRSFFSFRWIRSFWELFRCDFVLLGGGGLLTDDYTKKAPLLWFLHVLYIKLFRKPFVLVGNSIGPCHFFLSKFFVKKILQWSKENYIRDHASQKYIEETFQIRDTKKCSDCAFLFQIPKHQESLRKKKLLALNIRDWDMDFSELKIFIKNIMKQGYGVLFIPTEPKDTILFQEKIQHDAVIIHPKNFHQMILLLQKCEYAIGMRLHFLIGAMLAECKIGGIAYSKKVQGILEETDIPFVFPEHCTQKNLEHLFLKAKHPSSLEEKQKEVSDMFTALEKILYR